MDRRDFMKLGLLSVPVLQSASADIFNLTGLGNQLLTSAIKLKYQKLVPEIFEFLPTPPRHSRAIVIGSGFGGAVSALRLAEKGIQTTILERGSRWPNDPKRQVFCNDTLPDGRGFWHRDIVPIGMTGMNTLIHRFGGVFDVTSYQNLDVWRAACVGGGSQVFTGVMIAPNRNNFNTIFNGLLNYDEFNQQYYPIVRRMLNLDGMPADIYNSKPFGHSRVWDEQVRKAGFNPSLNDGIWNWDVVRKEISGVNRASAIKGESNLGNSNGAKFDLSQNYLKQAEQTGNAKIYPGHQVNSISFNGNTYEVSVIKLDPTGIVLDRYVLTCDYLFLAAGSVGTSELMVKAKAKGTLNKLNAQVGKGFGTNGDVSVSRTFNPIKGILQASPSASRIETTARGLPVTLENWYVPGLPVNLGIIGSLGMVLDMKNRGEFVYNKQKDGVDLLWAASGNNEVIAAAREVNNKICAATKTIAGVFPFQPDVNGKWTAHPLGGMVIGKATDGFGRVHGYQRLYVMDGALIPGSTGAVNPTLTITALAERNMKDILVRDI